MSVRRTTGRGSVFATFATAAAAVFARSLNKGFVVSAAVLATWCGSAFAGSIVHAAYSDSKADFLIKVRATATANFSPSMTHNLLSRAAFHSAKVERLGNSGWLHVLAPTASFDGATIQELLKNPDVVAVQPNYKIHLLENYRVHNPRIRAQLKAMFAAQAKNSKGFGHQNDNQNNDNNNKSSAENVNRKNDANVGNATNNDPGMIMHRICRS